MPTRIDANVPWLVDETTGAISGYIANDGTEKALVAGGDLDPSALDAGTIGAGMVVIGADSDSSDTPKLYDIATVGKYLDARAVTAITWGDYGATQYVENGVTVNITYDANGRVATVADGTTTRTAAYNANGTVASYT